MRSTASWACAWRGEAEGVPQRAKNKSVTFSGGRFAATMPPPARCSGRSVPTRRLRSARPSWATGSSTSQVATRPCSRSTRSSRPRAATSPSRRPTRPTRRSPGTRIATGPTSPRRSTTTASIHVPDQRRPHRLRCKDRRARVPDARRRRRRLLRSPVAADGRLYFANEDGDIFVVEAGRTYRELTRNSMNEVVMTTSRRTRGRTEAASLLAERVHVAERADDDDAIRDGRRWPVSPVRLGSAR